MTFGPVKLVAFVAGTTFSETTSEHRAMETNPNSQPVANESETPTASESTTPEERPLDPAILERVRSLQKAGRPSVLRKLTNLYLESTPEVVEGLRQAVSAADAKAMQHKAHRLKSSSLQVGARVLSSLCNKLEELGQSGSTAGAKNPLSHIEIEYERVCEALKEEIEAEPA